MKGLYRVENPEKYAGDPTRVVYRSSWELKLFKRLDRDKNVIEWSSEEIIIPYSDRSTGRLRRYFPDVYFKRKDGTKIVVEVKPLKETVPPKKDDRKTEKRFTAECLTYAKNFSKWEAARRWCAERGYEFKIITEKHLGV